MRTRIAISAALVLTGVAVVLLQPSAAVRAAMSGKSCGVQQLKNEQGIVMRILFAKNGAVQQYQVVDAQENMEGVHDFRVRLENQYGPAGINAPPLKIVSYKKGAGGGLMLPDKAMDSCGRTVDFNS